ncbi:MAG: hypothetical protein JJU46_06905 [Balneolaceae bacterium]|nr:hypothetical protein [Balneolaceae bacterium]MCH8548272.1 hypothetical protein [Balneolaceae bacterium]
MKSLTLSLLLSFFPFITFSQQFDTSNFGEKGGFSLNLSDVIELSEERYFLDQIRDISYISRDSIYILHDSREALILYTDSGNEQILKSSHGRGPFEMISPNILFLNDQSLYVWDSGQLKLLEFDRSGVPKNEFSGFRWAIKDFAVANNRIIQYSSGNTRDAVLQKYSLDPVMKIEDFEFGESFNEHNILNALSGTVSMAQNGDYLYWMSPAELTIHELNMTDGTARSQKIEDDQFYTPASRNYRETLVNMELYLNFLSESSYVADLIALDDFLVIRTVIGKEKPTSQPGILSIEERKFRFFIKDYSLNLIDSFTFKTFSNNRVISGTWFPAGSQIGFLTRVPLRDEDHYDEDNPVVRIYLYDLVRADA